MSSEGMSLAPHEVQKALPGLTWDPQLVQYLCGRPESLLSDIPYPTHPPLVSPGCGTAPTYPLPVYHINSV